MRNIKKTVVAGVFSTVRPFEYNQLTTARFRSDYGSAYTHCVQICIGALRILVPAPGKESETVGVFLEGGHKNSVQALQMIKQFKEQTDPIDMSGWYEVEVEDAGLSPLRQHKEGLRQKGLKIGAYGLGSKRAMLPLQAADLFAYCLHTEIATNSRDRLARIVIDDLISGDLPHYGFHSSEERIKELVEQTSATEQLNAEDRRVSSSIIRELSRYGFSTKPTPLGLDVNFENASEEGMKKYFPDVPKERDKRRLEQSD